MNTLLLFSGSSNSTLAEAVAQNLNVTLGSVEITRFIDNECRVFIKQDVAGCDVYVLQSLSAVADQHLVELCLFGTALKDMGAARVTAVIPWMGYSKQDKAFRRGEAVSASLVAKFIEVAGFDRVITCQLHSENVVPFFHIPVTELSSGALLAGYLPKDFSGCVVSPDKGGKSRSEKFASNMQLPIVYLDKTRDVETGEVHITGISGDVKGRDVVIFDDIINSGATAIKTSEFLKQHGVGRIYFLATHAVLAGNAVTSLEHSAIDKVIVADTVVIPKEKLFTKLSIVSVAPMLAEAIRNGNSS